MDENRIELGAVTVFVTDAGEAPQPWGRETGQNVHRYRVLVAGPDGISYDCFAYGSIDDYSEGVARDYLGMGWMVLDELWSAACDPDEFWTMAIGHGRPTRERVRKVERVIDAAEEFYGYLEGHEDEIRAGLDGETADT